MEFYNEPSEEVYANYLLLYLDKVLIPASNEFLRLLDENNLRLHHVYSFNTILAHAIDYILFIIKKKRDFARKDFIQNFDKLYAVDGCNHINNKFALLDAVNNSFKHVELDPKRYTSLIDTYGAISFNSLKEDHGKVFFDMPLHRFDYSRVVLRPIIMIFNCGLQSTKDIDDFINGRMHKNIGYDDFGYDYEPYEAIDRMIDYCNPVCMDCGEDGNNCDCQNFIYGGESGEFNPIIDSKFDYTDVISDISGTREWRK